MEDVLKIASYISQRYEYQFGSRIEEMKLHCLLYFSQRECLVETGQSLFAASFVAGKEGPFMPCVHHAYQANALEGKLSEISLIKYQSVFDHVFHTYAAKDMIGLKTLTQSELSWRNANADSCLSHEMQLSDMSRDADRIRNRRFLLKHLSDFRKPVYV